MQRITKRRAAFATALALVATSGTTAHAALVPDTGAVRADLQRTIQHITTDTSQTALDTAALADQVAGPLRELVRATVKRATGDASRLVGSAYSQVGFTAFAVVDRAGRLVAGSNGVSIVTPAAGRWQIAWGTSMRGCATVAMSNSVTPRVLRVQHVSPMSIRVLDRVSGASVRRSGFGVAVIC
jgi:hypothetical protein